MALRIFYSIHKIHFQGHGYSFQLVFRPQWQHIYLFMFILYDDNDVDSNKLMVTFFSDSKYFRWFPWLPL